MLFKEFLILAFWGQNVGHGIANFIFSCEVHMAIPWMDLWKIFYKTIGGEYNSIFFHFSRVHQYIFFLSQSLDLGASENLSAG